jgi:hypothetical protein
VSLTLGPVELVNANTVEEVGSALLKATAPHLVFASYHPVGRLRDALATGTTRFVVVLDDPRRAVGDAVAQHGDEFLLVAIRTVSKSLAALTNWDAIPGSLVLHGDTYRGAQVLAAQAIAHHFGLASRTGSGEYRRCRRRSGPRSQVEDDWQWWSTSTPRRGRRPVAGGAMRPIFRWTAADRLDRELFISMKPLPPPLQVRATPDNITGRARILIRSPFHRWVRPR